MSSKCNFCRISEDQAGSLVSGGEIFICLACAKKIGDMYGPGQKPPINQDPHLKCGFCHESQRPLIVNQFDTAASICDDCADEIAAKGKLG